MTHCDFTPQQPSSPRAHPPAPAPRRLRLLTLPRTVQEKQHSAIESRHCSDSSVPRFSCGACGDASPSVVPEASDADGTETWDGMPAMMPRSSGAGAAKGHRVLLCSVPRSLHQETGIMPGSPDIVGVDGSNMPRIIKRSSSTDSVKGASLAVKHVTFQEPPEIILFLVAETAAVGMLPSIPEAHRRPGPLSTTLPHVDDVQTPPPVPPQVPLQSSEPRPEGGIRAIAADSWLRFGRFGFGKAFGRFLPVSVTLQRLQSLEDKLS